MPDEKISFKGSPFTPALEKEMKFSVGDNGALKIEIYFEDSYTAAVFKDDIEERLAAGKHVALMLNQPKRGGTGGV